MSAGLNSRMHEIPESLMFHLRSNVTPARLPCACGTHDRWWIIQNVEAFQILHYRLGHPGLEDDAKIINN